MPSDVVFHSDAVDALTAAHEDACAVLGLGTQSSPLKDAIAQIIFERAQRGELDPVRLCEAVLDELRSHS
jgi:hypothetical protein